MSTCAGTPRPRRYARSRRWRRSCARSGWPPAGYRPISLDVLTPDEAYALLAHILGEQRASAEPEAVAELARLCAYLPLALRITAANLAETERVADYAARLAARQPVIRRPPGTRGGGRC